MNVNIEKDAGCGRLTIDHGHYRESSWNPNYPDHAMITPMAVMPLIFEDFQINEHADSSYPGNLDITLDGSRNLVACWRNRKNGNGDIYARC